MATILIVEDRPIDRKLLATTLRSHGHEVVEASDGEEALRVLTHLGAHLVISDILMPTVDGYEFVRRMRANPALASIPVIFYTATYHEHEARALASQCGVVDILTKPSAAEAIMATIDRALKPSTRLQRVPIDGTGFDREHLHPISSTLAARIDRFRLIKEQMAAVDEGAQRIAAERDPSALFSNVCSEARQITLAQHAILGLLTESGSARETLFTNGFESEIANRLEPPSVSSSVLAAVVAERRPVRTRNPDGRPETLGLPHDHPRVSSLLSVPIASPSRVYGWLSLRNKLGTDEFTDGDEHAAMTLGNHAGIAYENQCSLDHLNRRIGVLENELRRRASRDEVVRGEERAGLSRTLHDRLGQALVGLKMDLHWFASKSQGQERETAAKLNSMLEQLDEAIQFVMTLASELRPSSLGKHTLLAVVDREAKAFERRSGIRCRVDFRHRGRSGEFGSISVGVVNRAGSSDQCSSACPCHARVGVGTKVCSIPHSVGL